MKNSVQPAPSDLAAIVHSGGAWKKRKRFLWAGVALAVVGGCTWFIVPSSGKDQAQPYVLDSLHRGDLSLTITATGNLEPTNQITVGSELSGLIQSVFVDINDRVTKGQPIAQIETTKLTQQIASSRASLEAAKAQVALAEAALKEKEAALARTQELRKISNERYPSQADVDTAVANADSARATLQSAKASVAVAEAALRINENDFAKSTIKSPVDGIVLTRSVEPGQTVAASLNAPELFVIAEKLERMKLTITVAEADIGRVVAGLNATFTVDAWPDRVYHATVQRVSFGSTVTNNVVTYETELDVTNDDLSLRPGMTATAEIRVAEAKGVLLAPTAALRYTPVTATAAVQQKTFLQRMVPTPPRPQGKSNVPAEKNTPGMGRLWIVRDGTPTALDVKTGLTDGRYTEVSGESVTENQSVILRAKSLDK